MPESVAGMTGMPWQAAPDGAATTFREPTPAEAATRFAQAFARAVDQVNRSQLVADEQAQRFVSGEDQDLTALILATENARLHLELAVQIRNRVLEAYQEISRMPL